MERTFRILSIDGGGIRGLIAALVLTELESQTRRPVSELFDLIVGTSTGGILALSLVMPGVDGRPRYRAADVAALYLDERRHIFRRGWWQVLRDLGGLWGERYASAGIEGVLRRYFGEARLKDALVEVMVTAYDLERRDPFFFRSRRAREDPRYDYPLWAAARATSAAPTYFEPVLVEWPGHDRDVLVDGGVFANNPAMCAYAETQQGLLSGRIAADEILMVSVGTGQYTRAIPFDRAKRWGLAGWARPILDVIFDGVADTVDYQLGQLLPPRADGAQRYYRLQTVLDKKLDEMDNISAENMKGLERAAQRLLVAHAGAFTELAARLGAMAAERTVAPAGPDVAAAGPLTQGDEPLRRAPQR